MSIVKVDQSSLDAWVQGLIGQYPVIGIQAKDDRFDFAPLTTASDLRLDYDVSLTPPSKVVLQPPSDVLLTFDADGYHGAAADEPFVLLGVHPYDMVAINQMDKVFTNENQDDRYLARRGAATIVACDVQNASENVFAGCMGYASVKNGFDVLLTRGGDAYLAEARTDKGEALLQGLSGSEAADADLAAREQVWQDNAQNLRKHELKSAPADLPELLEKAYDHPVWKEKAELCFSCGSCVTLCPTCYCFDVQDDVNWDMVSGQRVRKWDGCMLESFAAVAGGHNFREDKTARFRHRYYRKAKYVPEIVGECACVGCGRCITVCVSKIAQPVEVFNRLLEEN